MVLEAVNFRPSQNLILFTLATSKVWYGKRCGACRADSGNPETLVLGENGLPPQFNITTLML